MANQLEDIALRLQGIINAAIDGIITIDDRGNIESINHAAATQFGYTDDEVIGNNVKMLMPEPYHSEHDGYLHRYNTTKKPRIIGIGREVVGKTKAGKHFPFRLAVSEVILNDRVIFTGIIHDLSDVKKAESELTILNEKLEAKVIQRTNDLEDAVNKLLLTNKKLEEREEELNAALVKEKELNELKSRFVSMASHEFRTPLSTILSSAQLISRYTDESHNEKREKHINRIKSAVGNLTGILNDFLSLSKIEEGLITVENEDVDVDALCNLVMDEVKGLLKKDQVIDHQSDNNGLVISSDKRILKNVLFNLLSNAIKYSNEGDSITCKINSSNDKHVEIQIIDSGIGIPEEDQKYMFERFFRANNVENIQGTGLGLNIVKRYVELLGGEITFTSELNKGTTFKVKIPLQ